MKMILAMSLQKMGYTLRFYRNLRGLSQMDLAHNAGLSFRNYQRLENGEVLPRIDTLISLGQELGLPLSDLVECARAEELGVRETFTEPEQKIFQILKSQPQKCSLHSMNLALVDSDLLLDLRKELFPIGINGNRVTVDDRFQRLFQLPANEFIFDELTAGAMTVDIWEFAARNNLKQMIVTNLLQLPIGLRLIEAYWHILSSSPEDTRCIGYFRDCTNQYKLEQLIKPSHKASWTPVTSDDK